MGSHWVHSGYRPNIRVDFEDVRTPEFLDSHNLRHLNHEALSVNIDQNRPRLGRSNSGDLPTYTQVTGRSPSRHQSDPTLNVPAWVLELNPLELEEVE